MFRKGFADYVTEGDSITCTVGDLDCRATLYNDFDSGSPEDFSDGFWPSLDPKSAGYIGPKSQRALSLALTRAREVMRAWEAGEWGFMGVAVTIEKDGVLLTGKYDHALWGIEANYPSGRSKRRNRYLRGVANDLLPEALAAARAKLHSLTAA